MSVAYNQWTQFESFPHFMTGVESITQVVRHPQPLGNEYRWRCTRVRHRDH